MRTSSIFAIFCLANGIVPSLAIPSGYVIREGKLSDNDHNTLLSELQAHKDLQNSGIWLKTVIQNTMMRWPQLRRRPRGGNTTKPRMD
ncbi:hypothetical protein F5148DRAFT_1255917 [Russula earlei]|uniref:Uncharacterized protein n=1 Tax=Russula earlei TaxID=71964 RepID=A0ACC0TSP0_9AGAM|nr:hypothetical protein F5148DRAFT_1255917 [Russula earlei]